MLAYLRLFRISNVFTVVADVTAGFVLVHGMLAPIPGYIGILLASCLLYTSGMILNDVFDIEVDREERPQRPLPSGAISLTKARILGFLFLLLGVALAIATSFLVGDATTGLRTTLWSICLAAAIIGYDAGLKRTPFGPIAMGSCRTFNFLMAMSLVDGEGLWDIPAAGVALAVGIGIYVAGITLFARTEAKTSNRTMLTGGALVMLLGLAIVGSMNYVDDSFSAQLPEGQGWFWPGLLTLIGATIGRRAVFAISDPSPASVQRTVKQALLSLIVFDACVLLFARPNEPYYAIFVLTLLAPTLWLGRWIRST